MFMYTHIDEIYKIITKQLRRTINKMKKIIFVLMVIVSMSVFSNDNGGWQKIFKSTEEKYTIEYWRPPFGWKGLEARLFINGEIIGKVYVSEDEREINTKLSHGHFFFKEKNMSLWSIQHNREHGTLSMVFSNDKYRGELRRGKSNVVILSEERGNVIVTSSEYYEIVKKLKELLK